MDSREEKSPSVKNLLEEEGVLDLLKEIRRKAEQESKPIIEKINKYLEKYSSEENKKEIEKDVYTLLRELRGLMADAFLGKERRAPTYRRVFDNIKHKIDSKLVERIELSHTFMILPRKATLLKEICPELFNSIL